VGYKVRPRGIAIFSYLQCVIRGYLYQANIRNYFAQYMSHFDDRRNETNI